MTEREQVVLAALLHDIGKFWERSDRKWNESDVIKTEYPNFSFSHAVPVYDNNSPKYAHALWTQAFFSKVRIDQKFQLENIEGTNLNSLATRHHKPENFLEGVISLADKWSSSIDRPDEGEENTTYAEIKNAWGERFNTKIPLQSIFDSIKTKENESLNKNHGYSLRPLNVLDYETIFPALIKEDPNSPFQHEYKQLWEGFIKEFEALLTRCKTFSSFYISLCDLLRKYTWCIPSATNVNPANVNLYEHLKTTAAIAMCIYDYYKHEKKEITYNGVRSKAQEDDCLLMVCIDLSGIQKFIYDIANKKAAKSLKGRSFYLQLIIKDAIDQILRHPDINAFPTNVIYASGGKAYLLLPNLPEVKSAIDEIDKKMQAFLWDEFQGKLYMVFGSVAFRYVTYKDTSDKWVNEIESNDLNETEKMSINYEINNRISLGDIWRMVSDRASAKKHKKFLQKVLDFDELFNPIPFDGNVNKKCQVTGIRSNDLRNIGSRADEESAVWVLPSVYNQTALGGRLSGGQFLAQYFNYDANADNSRLIQLPGASYEIVQRETINSLKSSKYDEAVVYSFNQSFSDNQLNDTGIQTLFYGGNKQPLVNQSPEPKTFEELATLENGSRTKIAILRMDVDNLGQIFIKGFDDVKVKKSFAAYSTLSFMLEAFFSGHINYIRQLDEYRDHVQILYSGGDDLFAVGRWDKIIDFAYDVRSSFLNFTQREDISISGGIAIVGAKYPISKAADLAGELEDKAKKFGEGRKNAINIFGETVGWGEEFEMVRGIKQSFMYFDDDVSRSLIHTIQKSKIKKDQYKYKNKKDLSYMWQTAYTLTRMLDRMKGKKDEQANEFVDTLRNNILHNEKFGCERYLDLASVAARWAEYLLKLKN